MTRSTPDSDPLGAAIRSAATEIRAPRALRERVEAHRPQAGSHGVPAALLAGALAVVAGAAALGLAIGLLGGLNVIEGPTLARAADAALHTATEPPPAEDASGVLVRAGIAGLRFPYWDDQFGLDAVAMRHETVGGRRAITVEYRGGGQRIGYTILAGRALGIPSPVRWVQRGRIRLATLMHDGATVVTWQRAGHTCVLASRNASARRLLSLAAWTGGGRISGYGR